MAEIGPYFDFTSLYRPMCNDTKLILSQKRYFKKSLNKFNISYLNMSKKNYFGYPLTNNEHYNYTIFGTLVYAGLKSLENELHNNIILMDLYLKNKKLFYKNEFIPEVFVILKKTKPNLEIKIKKNKTLIQQRTKISDKRKEKPFFKNVLVFFFDTISRAHFFRKFPKTINYLEQYTKYKRDYKKKKFTIFQFLKYHSLNTFTNPNLMAAYFGAKIDGNGTHFANYFKNNGYIIGKATTFCEKINVYSTTSSLNNVIWDHESISIPCIRGIYNYRLSKRLYSLVRRCLFGKDIFEYSLEYLESFWLNYLKYNKMFLFESGDGHEPTGQTIGYLDDIFYKFLFKFNSNKWFKNTAIILFSDHGQHLLTPFMSFYSYDIKYEMSLPFLFLFLPNKDYLYENNLYEIIKENQQIFITPYDIYDTLIHFAYGNDIIAYKNFSVPLGNSLLTKLNYKERYCDSIKFDSQINMEICNCKKL